MNLDVYVQLAEALDRLPNGFPRTESGVELEVLKRIFTLEEARIAGMLRREMESIIDISEKTGLDPETAKEMLSSMAKKKMLKTTDRDIFLLKITNSHISNGLYGRHYLLYIL